MQMKDNKRYKINSKYLVLFFTYLIPILILMRFYLYPSLYGYDSNVHVLVSDYIIANAHFPVHSIWIELGPDDAILPLFNSFFGMICIMTNVPTYHMAKYIFPALSFTMIFIFASLILKSMDKAKFAFSFIILCLFFVFISPKVLQNLSYSVRPEILGILLLLAFKYTYIRFIKGGQSKDLIISLMIGITIILTHYLAGLFLASSLLIYGIFFEDKKVFRYKTINEFTISLALFVFFWGIAIFKGGPIYRDLSSIFGLNKFSLFLIPLVFAVVIKKSAPFGITKFEGLLSRLKNLFVRYQTVLILSLSAVLFASLKIVSTTTDFKIFSANNIHWVIFIPLSFLYLLNHILSENKDRSISFLSCFLIFSYFFSFIFLFGIYSGIAGFYSTDWIIRFIGYAFFEMTVLGMFFARDNLNFRLSILKLKNLKSHIKVALLLVLLITNILITAYYVDKPGDKYPLMVASDPMLSAERYVVEEVKPKYVAGFTPFTSFIYDGFDFNKRLEIAYYPGRLPFIINNLAENKKPDHDLILFVNLNQIEKTELSKMEENPFLNKIYSNAEIFIGEAND